jgi:hypothetical protein
MFEEYKLWFGASQRVAVFVGVCIQSRPTRVSHSTATLSDRMADEHDHDDGDAHAKLEEATVDDSQLKLPAFSWEGAQQDVKSMEEDEDVLYKQ